jgi:glycosyltransferase involved in cell wall biosynthesis
MNLPKISIVTPSYNQGQYLEDTILSVLGQFYPNLEYFIYDAGSTDHSVEIIKKYEDKITFWVSEKDKGQADAINKGFLKCTGDILMWLNSDDILMPNVLHFIAEQYMEHGDGIYFGNCIHFKELSPSGSYASGSNVISKFNAVPLQLSDTIIQPSSFWSKDVWLKNGPLIENFHFGFDWEWFLRAEKNNIPFYPINRPLSLYRFHKEHKSSTGGDKRRDELYEIYKIYNPSYAKLYQLIRNVDFTSSPLQSFIFKVGKLIFRKKFTKTYFVKLLNRKKFKDYTVLEIDRIRGML